MRLLTGALIVLTLATGSLRGSAVHVHLYASHDHAEHHHGPAAHDHIVAHHAADEEARVEACDPGQHALSVVARCAAATPLQSLVALSATPASVAPLASVHALVQATDTRAHGPPLDARTLPRAPPASRLI